MLALSRISKTICLFNVRDSARNLPRILSSSSHLRLYSIEPLKAPSPDDSDKVYPEKIQNIVNDISNLTILEVRDLNELLKKTLNIPDAPMMAMGAMAGLMPSQQLEDEEDAESSATKVQTNFTVRITKFDESKKIAIIKHVKTIMEGMNLVQVKKFIETLPAIVRTDASKDEAESLVEGLRAVGAECVIE